MHWTYVSVALACLVVYSSLYLRLFFFFQAEDGIRDLTVTGVQTCALPISNLLHFGLAVVGLNYGFAGQMRLDEVTGGSPYGATTITGGDGSRQPSDNELAGARYQGRAIAETAKKLHG